MSVLIHSIPLPDHYRADEVIAFHGRDPSQLSESIQGGVLRKGFMLDGRPALLTIALGQREVRHAVGIDGAAEKDVSAIVQRMLGLHGQPQVFEALVADDPLLGAVVARQRGLRIPQTATGFEALTWAIIGQQIGLGFAITLRRRFIELAGARHSTGLACYPDAGHVVGMSAEALGRLQFSRAKSEALIRVARLIEDGKLNLESLAAGEPGTAFEALVAIKGIGPWTANYVLMRGLGAMDCSLHGDAAVRSAIVRIMGRDKKLDQTEAQTLLAQYRPWRSLVAAHLWASHSLPA